MVLGKEVVGQTYCLEGKFMQMAERHRPVDRQVNRRVNRQI